ASGSRPAIHPIRHPARHLRDLVFAGGRSAQGSPVSVPIAPVHPLRDASARRGVHLSRGSSLMMEASWVLPTQKVVPCGRFCTKVRRRLVKRGRRYCTKSPVVGVSLKKRASHSPPLHTSTRGRRA